MSVNEHVFLSSGLSVAETASRVAAALGTDVVPSGDGQVAVHRHPASDPLRWVGGELTENPFREEDPEPEDEALHDGYPVAYEIRLSGTPDEELLHAEAGKIFDEIVGALHWPAVHVTLGGSVFAAFSPELGRRDFPPRTAYTVSGRDRWIAYAAPHPPAPDA